MAIATNTIATSLRVFFILLSALIALGRRTKKNSLLIIPSLIEASCSHPSKALAPDSVRRLPLFTELPRRGLPGTWLSNFVSDNLITG